MLLSVAQLELRLQNGVFIIFRGPSSSLSWLGRGLPNWCGKSCCSLGCAKTCFNTLCSHMLTKEVETTRERLEEKGTLKSGLFFSPSLLLFRPIGKIISFNSV